MKIKSPTQIKLLSPNSVQGFEYMIVDISLQDLKSLINSAFSSTKNKFDGGAFFEVTRFSIGKYSNIFKENSEYVVSGGTKHKCMINAYDVIYFEDYDIKSELA